MCMKKTRYHCSGSGTIDGWIHQKKCNYCDGTGNLNKPPPTPPARIRTSMTEGTIRDPDRIPRICQEIQKLWAKHPDLRLGQLIMNSISPETDPYYKEDEDLMEAIKNHLTKFE